MLKTNKKGCSKLWEALKSICNNSATYLLLLFQLFGLRFCIELWTFKASSKFFLLEPSGNWQFGSSNEPV